MPHILDDDVVANWIAGFCLDYQSASTDASLIFFLIDSPSSFYKLAEASIDLLIFWWSQQRCEKLLCSSMSMQKAFSEESLLSVGLC